MEKLSKITTASNKVLSFAKKAWLNCWSVAILIFFATTIANAQVTSGAVYKLRNQCSSKVLDVSGISQADSAVVHQWTDINGLNQQWKIDTTNSGYYRLTAQHSQKALDVRGSSTANGATVQQYASNGTNAQQWKFVDVGDGYYKLESRLQAGKVLDVSGASTADGAKVQLWTDNSTCAQKWKLELIGGNGSPYDLVVTSITQEPSSPVAGNAVKFKATVKNQGGRSTPAGIVIGVSFAVDGAQVSWSDTYQSSLAAGASVVLTANNGPDGDANWTATSGAHTVRAEVDDINRLPEESNETNNILEKTLTVGGGGGGSTGEQARSAFNFVDGFGIHVPQIGWWDSSELQIIQNVVNNLGIRRIRTGLYAHQPEIRQRINSFADATNSKLMLVINCEETTADQINPALSDFGSRVWGVEGRNEVQWDQPCRYDGANPEYNAVEQLKDYSRIVRAFNSNIKILTSSSSYPGQHAGHPNVAQYADFANEHTYGMFTTFGERGDSNPAAPFHGPENEYWRGSRGAVDNIKRMVPGENKGISTEYGYATERVSGEYSTYGATMAYSRGSFEHFNNGFVQWYLHEPIRHDGNEDYAIADSNGTLRPMGRVVKNTIEILRDSTNFQPGKLDYSLSASISTLDDKNPETNGIHHTLLQKSTGEFYLALWQATPYIEEGQASVSVTVNVTTPISGAVSFDPVLGTSVQQSFTTQSFTLQIPNHVVILKITPR